MQLTETYRNILKNYFAQKPVIKAWILGSYACNEADPKSDIDILVELDHTQPIGMKFFSFHYELERLLNKKVDVVSYDGISKYVRPFVDRDKILIYERGLR